LKDFCLIYADFTGHYSTFVEPLFEHISDHISEIKKGLRLIVTYSDNGGGTVTERNISQRKFTEFYIRNSFDIDDEMTCNYGGQMNVVFLVKK
jgi:hypothetical protein